MSFFGMGSMEIVVIMIIALIIFGPGKLPEIAAQAGKAVRDFRRVTRDLTAEFQDSIDDVQSTMDDMKSTVNEMRRETEELATSIPSTVDEGVRRPLSEAGGVMNSNRRPSPGSNGAQADVPIAEVPAPVATRTDPLADLVEFQEELDEPERPISGR
jgi:TatA/E family protein of Tat protein translocase